jgi:hypothetical protein
MSVFDKHHDALEHHETMMGLPRGRLAVALDLLTDSLALVGQHGVYCASERFPGKPKMESRWCSSNSKTPSSSYRARCRNSNESEISEMSRSSNSSLEHFLFARLAGARRF